MSWRAWFAVGLAACDWSSLSATPPPIDGGVPPASSVVPRPGGSIDAGPLISAPPVPRDGTVPGTLAPPPEPLTVTDVLPRDSPAAKIELTEVQLQARWIWPQPTSIPAAASAPGLARVRAKTALEHTIRIASNGRMALRFRSAALPLPSGCELLGRSDRYGHLLVWPDGGHYRIVVPGALRALLDDRRIDVVPFSKATLSGRGNGKHLGHAVRIVELKNSYGALTLQLARVAESGFGGPLLCRVLIELAGADPATPVCRSEPEPEVPLLASFVWTSYPGEEGTRFEVTSLTVRDKDVIPIAVPPLLAVARSTGLPGPDSAALVGKEDLASLHSKDPAAPTDRIAPGLEAIHGGDRNLYLVVDGIPVAYLAPGGRLRFEALRRGSYQVQWRTLLGEEATVPANVEVPGITRFPTQSQVIDDSGGK